jgi:hypothetical protein
VIGVTPGTTAGAGAGAAAAAGCGGVGGTGGAGETGAAVTASVSVVRRVTVATWRTGAGAGWAAAAGGGAAWAVLVGAALVAAVSFAGAPGPWSATLGRTWVLVVVVVEAVVSVRLGWDMPMTTAPPTATTATIAAGTNQLALLFGVVRRL